MASKARQSGSGGSRAPRRDRLQKTKDVLAQFSSKNDFTLGDFLQCLLDPATTADPKNDSCRQALSKWLKGGTKPGTCPAEIIDTMYRHPYSYHFDNKHLRHASFHNLSPPNASPAYLDQHPQDNSLLPLVPNVPSDGSSSEIENPLLYNAREGLEELMARGTLSIIDREASNLCDASTGLRRGTNPDWDEFEDYTLEGQQDRMRTLAPVTWAVLSAIAYNRDRVVNKAKANARAQGEEHSDVGEEDEWKMRDPVIVSHTSFSLD